MLSRLICDKCGQKFEYKWIPFISFTSIRFGKWRYLRCPKCHRWSWFNILDNKVMK